MSFWYRREQIEKAKHGGNPYHDELGLFTSKDKAKKANSPFGAGGLATFKDKEGKTWEVQHEENTSYLTGDKKQSFWVYPEGSSAEDRQRRRGYVAGFELHATKDQVMSAMVDAPYRRKGIASSTYDLIEQHLGRPLQQHDYQSDDAKAMWAARHKKKG